MKKFFVGLKDFFPVLIKVVIATAIFVLAVVNYDKLTNINIRDLVSGTSNVFAAGLIVICVYFTKSVLFIIPASLVYISVGLAFETWQALIINLLGIALEVTVTFFLGKFLGGSAVEKIISKNKGGQKLLNLKPKSKLSFLLMVRALPVFPIDFASLFLGASGFEFLKYFSISLVGIMPRVVLFTILGDGIYDYIPMRLIVTIALCCIPVAVVYWCIKFIVKSRKNTNIVETDKTE
ncbi:MAG TPA: VTT domain-containing protein [Clostridia bacterium]|nr:VTT domain-containing protein [Clostridia bacterium]